MILNARNMDPEILAAIRLMHMRKCGFASVSDRFAVDCVSASLPFAG
jgi:hypothetical protein